MKANANPSPNEKTLAEQIDAIIQEAEGQEAEGQEAEGQEAGGWKGRKLSQLRALIKAADPAVVEEVKWKKPSKPEGVPVWSHDGIICVADILKNAVRLTFPKGVQIEDPQKLFNTRSDSKTVRAIDFSEGGPVDEAALQALILDAVRLNTLKGRKQ